MKRRNRLEIMAEILSLCKRPQTKTKVMYSVSLSWKVLVKYLSYLQSQGLLKVHNSPIEYATTPKGLSFVGKWTELAELI
ncbi:MAG: winged helix-turn-helix domain-containing protein [Candidatus Bathyarchaeota archaeon]|nr:winged helix-turn-helix domain-containing protein [Candidatus Bathyarchaeota archaeon]